MTRVFPKETPKTSSNRTIMIELIQLDYSNHDQCNYARVLPSPLICRLPSVSYPTCISVWSCCIPARDSSPDVSLKASVSKRFLKIC